MIFRFHADVFHRRPIALTGNAFMLRIDHNRHLILLLSKEGWFFFFSRKGGVFLCLLFPTCLSEPVNVMASFLCVPKVGSYLLAVMILDSHSVRISIISSESSHLGEGLSASFTFAFTHSSTILT